MKSARILCYVVAVILLAGITACSDLRCDDDLNCSPCRHPEIVDNGKTEECRCVPDTGLVCPAEIVHGYFDFGLCECQCIPGWMGAVCSERDTAFYISLFHGTDTLALLDTIADDSIGTHVMDLISYPDSEVVKCTFPVGSAIDSLKLARYPNQRGTFLFCEEEDCVYLRVYFTSGDSAYSVSDTLVIESVSGIHYTRGRFDVNLSITGSGQPYYIREGKFVFPF